MLLSLSNTCLINIILSLSNLLGIFPIYNLYTFKRYKLSYCLLYLIFVSSIHHLIETNEVGHNLHGIKIVMIYKYGYLIRYLDILTACVFFLLVLYSYNIECIILVVNSQKKTVIFSIISSFLCDFVIRNRPLLYFILHGIWHSGVYYMIYKLSLIH